MERFRIFSAGGAQPLMIGLVYYLLAHFSLTASMGDNGLAAIWPPSGILLAALLMTRRVRWPGIILACGLASLAANYAASSDFLLACGFALANLAESLLVIRLLGPKSRRMGAFGEPFQIIRFALAAMAGGLASASMATFFVGGWSAAVFVSWATTVILGMLIVTPMIITTAHHLSSKCEPITARDVWLGLLALCLVAGLTILVFAQSTHPLLFLPLAAVIIVTYLFGPSGAAASVFVIAVIGSLAAASGWGPILVLDGDRQMSVMFFQFFLAVALMSSFPLAALLEQRARALADLEHGNRMLEMAERAAHVGHWRVDLVSMTIFCSAEVYRIHGLPPDCKLSLDDAIRSYHPDDRKKVSTSLQHTLDTGIPFRFDARLVRPGGEVRHITSSGELERNPANGEPVAVFGMFMDVTDKVKSLHQLEEARSKAEFEARNAAKLAETDQLTGLANRRKILEDLRTEIARAESFGQPLTIAVLDVDHFKKINDTLGHATGDEVLFQLGGIFTRTLRKTDKVGRVGGEEFVIILPGTGAETATPLAERLRMNIAETIWPGSRLKQVTVSIGIASYARGQDDRHLMLAADKALYKAKSDGRNLLRVAA